MLDCNLHLIFMITICCSWFEENLQIKCLQIEVVSVILVHIILCYYLCILAHEDKYFYMIILHHRIPSHVGVFEFGCVR